LILAEEGANQLGLMLNAAMQAAAMGATERQNVRRNLIFHDANASGLLIGAPRPGQRETLCPEAEDWWLKQLKATLGELDIVFMDNFASLFSVPSENDNQAITSVLRRIAKAAHETQTAVVVIHHSPKQSRETTASQSGEVTMARGGSAFAN